jgi:thiol-disulfide isomerase/thioredoxin
MNLRLYLVILAVAVLAGFGGAAAYRSLAVGGTSAGTERMLADGQRPAEQMVGLKRPDYTLGSSTGARVSAADFDGKVVLVNFWATWCQPCREEMPMLAELYREHGDAGLEVVGIALDEVAAARGFAAELGIDYPILVGSTDVMAVVRLYGNVSGVLPYSVLVDRGGVIRWTRLGVLEEATLRREIGGLLESG